MDGVTNKQYKSMHDREHLINQFVYYFFTTDEKNEGGVTETAAHCTTNMRIDYTPFISAIQLKVARGNIETF